MAAAKKISTAGIQRLEEKLRQMPRRVGAGTRRLGIEFGVEYDAVITDRAVVNGGIQFKYTIQLGHWNMKVSEAAGGTWVNDSGTAVLLAFSSAEDMNRFASGTGTIGTGNTSVAQADGKIGTSSCKLKPLPIGGYVGVKFRGVGAAGQLYFTIVNAMNSAQ